MLETTAARIHQSNDAKKAKAAATIKNMNKTGKYMLVPMRVQTSMPT